MKKIAIEISNDTLVFKYRTNKPVDEDLLNTNVISNNELVFSDEYLKKNTKIVGLFIADLINEKKITKITISNNEIAEIVVDLFKNVGEISLLNLKDDVNISYTLCEKISKLANIKKINCYSIPTFMIEMLDKKKIEVESRNEILFTSSFMEDNNLTSFSKIYYKSSVRIKKELDEFDINDFKSFIKINKYLKTIHLEKCNLPDIKELCEILIEVRKKNINIIIHDDINDVDIIDQLKILNRKYKKKSKIKLSLVYSKSYLERNYLKQIIFTTLKICALIIFTIVGSVFGYIFYNNFQSERKVEDIKTELTDIMKTTKDEEEAFKKNNPEIEDVPLLASYQKLLEKNEDTVGWLTVKGTKIDYPVVQSNDNSYYLSRNFNREKDYNGWVFMDYRNSTKELDTNTIIYAHNRYYSGVMFGTLNTLTKKKWLNNPENYDITFNTLREEQTWRVFSVYNIEITSDYLYTNFSSNEQYQRFLNLITKRSIHNFGTEVSVNDKILTLSTCLDNNRRLVVHAVLQKKEEEVLEEEETNQTVVLDEQNIVNG